jgi:hypothetical protein
MVNRIVELLWNFGFSDECQVLIIEKRGDLMTIVGEVKDSAKTIQFYVDELKALAAKHRYSYARSHLPRDGWINSLGTGQSPKDVLEASGFFVEPWMERARSEHAA